MLLFVTVLRNLSLCAPILRTHGIGPSFKLVGIYGRQSCMGRLFWFLYKGLAQQRPFGSPAMHKNTL